MQQTDNASRNSSEFSSMKLSKLTNQTDIVRRLEELNRWQEEQKKLLEAKQTMQRQMLGMEQRTMYEAMGLQCSIEDKESPQEDKEKAQEWEKDKLCEDYEEYSELGEENLNVNGESAENYEPTSYKTLTSGYGTEEPLEAPVNKPKKTFLKRGQGLKQRFKIDPEELRITNLPKYKYANAHPALKSKTGKPPLGVKPKPTIKPPSPTKALDAQEQRFQQLLISSKNVCNSTPDMKSSLASSKNTSTTSGNISSTLNKVRFAEPSLAAKKINECPPNEGPTEKTHGMSWSKILDNQQIQALPVIRETKPNSALPPTEDDIFEMLEQKAKEGSFDMDSTYIKQFLQQRMGEKYNESDCIPIAENLKTKRLQPVMVRSNTEDDASSLVEEEDDVYYAAEEMTEADDETVETTCPASNERIETHVRFSESHDTYEYREDETVRGTSEMSLASGDHTNPEFFEQFKQALFAALQFKADKHNENEINESASETTLCPKDSNTLIDDQQAHMNTLDLQEKSEMIKIRLQELNKEIATFKENNIQLLKAKQEHEFEKAVYAQEQLEEQERLKDEKIQMEIYLHDERMKMEEEKRKYEQQIKLKTQTVAATKNKEIEKLREQVTQLESQLKSKETNHAAAQARWRTQIRSIEREEKKLHDQIELLTKENKRLENEILKVSREHSNKMLQEINRNIAKIAPKVQANTVPGGVQPVAPTRPTLSQTIIARATENKNSKSSIAQRRPRRMQKVNKNNVPDPRNPLPDTPSSGETESTPENSFCTSKNSKCEDDEKEENILQELRSSAPDMRRNIPQMPKKNQKTHPQSPAVPPTSPINMKHEIPNDDGSKDIWYPNGNLKKISADGMIIRMMYYNKDIKETNINEGTVKYYYAETNTWHTSYLDGLEILEFPNGQVEHRHKNGVVEVHYPNNSVRIINPHDETQQEEWRFPDGTNLVQLRNGDKILSLLNGQKEIHTKLQKRREYPDGTVKIVYPDGSTETRYSNGRIRLKDKDGKLVMDTEAVA